MNLPDYIDPQSWAAWIEMREEMRDKPKRGQRSIPFTERAKQIALNRLDQFNDFGYDCNYILDDAVINGWRGLFVNGSTPRLPSTYLKVQATYSASDKAYYDEMRKKHPELSWPA